MIKLQSIDRRKKYFYNILNYLFNIIDYLAASLLITKIINMKRIAFLVLLQIITVGAFSQTIEGTVMRSGSSRVEENRNKISFC